MSKPRKDQPLKKPRYRGGDAALRKFVDGHLVYPPEALAARIEGDVEVAYDVDGLGRVKQIEVIQSLGYGCDEEVVRLVRLLKFEKAFNKGRTVTSHKKLKVNFKLPQKPVKNVTINYSITTSKKEVEQKKEKTLGYKINY
ncbi:energy transducer TonB [Roseivirga misakiensis]|uniref:TonB C-terminal domain-containing protein n=1 Tax=Roseivirga misakiensis TaxID=1563681 RepID=A0A1E5T0S3_9BACT|nr:energy transducer TonB [Roseivirga misakiensis]OEK04961.1 hypothetical protein BFP71_16150 [Roseivirga misakiensis]